MSTNDDSEARREEARRKFNELDSRGAKTSARSPNIRRLSSEFEGERTAAVNTLLSKLKSHGLDIHDVADVIEGATGEIGGAKLLTEDHAKGIYERGVEEGKRRAGPGLNPDFYESDGSPRWHEIALFCQEQTPAAAQREGTGIHRRHGGEDALPHADAEDKGDWLLAIFYRLGGKRR